MKTKKKGSRNPKRKRVAPDFWTVKNNSARAPHGYWKEKKNRVEATKWLVKTLRKDPLDITPGEFRSHGLSSLLAAYNNNRCAAYERGEFLTYDPGYLPKYPTRVARALIEAGFNLKVEDFAVVRGPKKRRALGYWKKRENRIAAIRQIVDDVGGIHNVTTQDFDKHGLSYILKYYNKSVIKALKDAGYEIQPWELGAVPNGFWAIQDNRIIATRWLVDKLGGDPQQVSYNDFLKEGLRYVINVTGGVLEALNEAGYGLKPWECASIPRGVWDLKENRAAAVKWLIASRRKKPSEISLEDFTLLGLRSLATRYGIHRLLTEAGYKMGPWECFRAPSGTWESKKNRVAAVKWVIARTKKRPLELRRQDFLDSRLGSLVREHSLYGLLTEAGYVTYPWEMRVAPKGTWNSRKNRVAAVQWMMDRLEKDLSEVTPQDFIDAGLRTLVRKHEPSYLLKEAGYKVKS